MPLASTTGSFSIRCLARIRSASSSVVPTGAVTRFSLVIASWIGWSRLRSNCRSRLVTMPTSRPSASTIGTPEIRNRLIRLAASRSGRSGPSVIGFRIIPLSLRLTRSTSAACRSMDMFLCSTPIPPARAIAMAISDSVTVSMAAETSGTFRGIVRVKREAVRTSRGWTVECRGTSRTSSKVSPTVGRMMAIRSGTPYARRPTGGAKRPGPDWIVGGTITKDTGRCGLNQGAPPHVKRRPRPCPSATRRTPGCPAPRSAARAR